MPVQAVAAALIDDLSGHGLRVLMESLSGPTGTIASAGRTGAFLDAASARAEVAAVCSCPIGIFETDDTHDWTMVWTEDTLPEDGPLRLKVVAETLASNRPTDQPLGVLTVTVFDASAPMASTTLDVPFPSAKGKNESFVELHIEPRVNVSFTVQRTGAGRHYRLGASHAALRLGQTDVRYLPGHSQDWAIDVTASENVKIELATDTGADDSTQATSGIVTVVDAATNEVVHGPTRLTFTLDSPQAVGCRAAHSRRLSSCGIRRPDRLVRSAAEPPTCFETTRCPLSMVISFGVIPASVFVVNASSGNHQVASNPHPLHTDCPPLNTPGFLPPGDSGPTSVFDIAGTCGFHDHLDPRDATMQGRIHITEPS